VHPDGSRVRRALELLDELWRRSGGTLPAVAPDALRRRIRDQLEAVGSWDEFQRARIVLDPQALVDDATRERLDALPGMIRIRGDAAPLDYELEQGEPVARVRLREGQAKRLRSDDLPPLDRPLRFAVQRGRHAPLLADTIPALQALLKRAPRPEWSDEGDGGRRGGDRGGRGGGKGRGRRGGPNRSRPPGRRR